MPDGGPAAHGSQPRPPPGLSWTRGGDSREPTAPPCVSSAGSVQGCQTCPPRPASVWTALKGPPEASAAASSSAFTTQGHRSLRAWPRRCPSKVLGCEFLPLFTRVRDRSRSLLSREREREGGRQGGSRGASHRLKTKPQGPPRRPDAAVSLRRGPRTTLPTARLPLAHPAKPCLSPACALCSARDAPWVPLSLSKPTPQKAPLPRPPAL